MFTKLKWAPISYLCFAEVHELLAHHLLRHLHQQQQHVRDALPADGASGHNADHAPRVGVLPVQGRVEALLLEHGDRLEHAAEESSELYHLFVLSETSRYVQQICQICATNLPTLSSVPKEQPSKETNQSISKKGDKDRQKALQWWQQLPRNLLLASANGVALCELAATV
jgi:hypothetical protein